MPNRPTYSELLKHPLWQRKRLEILQRSNFRCETCDAGEKTLHVHHTYYEKGLRPWEYPDDSYRCLCEDCHEQAQDVMTLLHRAIGKLSGPETEELLGYAMGLEGQSNKDMVLDVFSHEVAAGIASAWDIDVELLVQVLQEGRIHRSVLYEMWEQGRRRT